MSQDISLGLKVSAMWDSLNAERQTWMSHWQEIADYVVPRKADIWPSQASGPTGYNRADVLFDSTAVYSNAVLANGMLSYITPSGARWFAFDPPESKADNDEVKRWFAKITEITHRHLANSNFYSEQHEFYHNSGGFGTAAMLVQEGKKSPLNFQSFDIGTYAITEDDEGHVDRVFREYQYSILQLAEKFGEENLSEKLRAELKKCQTTGKGGDVKHCVVHGIYPREKKSREEGKSDPKNKPYASVYIEQATKKVLLESGYDEQPVFVSRYLKWKDSVYGYCPSWMALPEARQLNYMVKNHDALSELMAFPRLLIPDTHEGGVDMRPGGGTFFDPNLAAQGALPKEWATSGRYDVGVDREKLKREAIERAYHVDLFNMFARIERQMTAYETAERAAEKLTQFTPAFTRMTTEVIIPMLQRVFGLLMRGGFFPPPPRAALDIVGGQEGLRDPEITFSSRVALAIKAQQNNAWQRVLSQALPLVEIRPDILDNFNLDKGMRDTALNEGLPEELLAPQDEVDKIRSARAQAQAEAAQQQQAMMAAETAAKAGTVKNDSMLAQALGGGL